MTYVGMTEEPILVGGDGRSGTTLLSVVLDSHPDVWMGQELHFRGPVDLGPHVIDCIDRLEANDPSVMGKALYANETYRPGVQFVRRVVRCGFEWPELRSSVEAAMAATGTDLAALADRCALMAELGRRGARRAGKARWGFKIMREIQGPEVYADAWPRASFVHIIRDGRDVAASQMLDHASWGYKDIDTAATGWATLIARSRAKSRGKYVELRFEDLVREPRVAGPKLLDDLGLLRTDAILAHETQSHDFFGTKVRHPSRDAVMRPLNTAVVGRYRSDLSAEQIARFEAAAGETLAALGYLDRS